MPRAFDNGGHSIACERLVIVSRLKVKVKAEKDEQEIESEKWGCTSSSRAAAVAARALRIFDAQAGGTGSTS